MESRTVSAAPLPMVRRTPRGRLRWYMAQVPEGMEDTTARKLLRILPESVLASAFAMRKERLIKLHGVWKREIAPAFPGYFFLSSADAPSLYKALSTLSFHVRMAGDGERAWAPVPDEAMAWYLGAVDSTGVIRTSVANIVNGELRAESGPLVGSEHLVERIDRHKCKCWLRLPDGGAGFTELIYVEIPSKS